MQGKIGRMNILNKDFKSLSSTIRSSLSLKFEINIVKDSNSSQKSFFFGVAKLCRINVRQGYKV